MLWLIRFAGLLFKAVTLEFVHIFGLIIFLITIPIGYFRGPWWIIPVLAGAAGLISYNFIDHVYLTDVFERAVSANRRGAFVVVVYFAITIIGYIVGLLSRIFVSRPRRSN